MVGAEPGLQDGLGALVGIACCKEIPEAAQYVTEVVQAAAHIRVIGAKLCLQDRVGALE
jgi:hypothetical protein